MGMENGRKRAGGTEKRTKEWQEWGAEGRTVDTIQGDWMANCAQCEIGKLNRDGSVCQVGQQRFQWEEMSRGSTE